MWVRCKSLFLNATWQELQVNSYDCVVVATGIGWGPRFTDLLGAMVVILIDEKEEDSEQRGEEKKREDGVSRTDRKCQTISIRSITTDSADDSRSITRKKS